MDHRYNLTHNYLTNKMNFSFEFAEKSHFSAEEALSIYFYMYYPNFKEFKI